VQVLKKLVVAVSATLALGLVLAAGAGAADRAGGVLLLNTGQEETEPLGDFRFNPRGEHVWVRDLENNGWGVLVELWWGGRLQRWCYNIDGPGTTQECNLSIPDGAEITFFIAEIDDDNFPDLDRNARREALLAGEGKRPRVWAGPSSRNGCWASSFTYPCGARSQSADFFGEA
jgi:hypothetical protein